MTGIETSTAHPAWFEARLPHPIECSIGYRLFERARSNPPADFIVTEDGMTHSNALFYEQVAKTAGRLQQAGVAPGDRVAVWLPTGPDMVRLILAISLTRAVIVPLNPALRGNMLASAIQLVQPKLIVQHPELAGRLEEIDIDPALQIVLTGRTMPARLKLAFQLEADLAAPAASVEPGLNKPWDIAAIIFSSGTTGAAKGVLVPYAQVWSLAESHYGYMNETDRMLLMYPLHHIAGYSGLMATMINGSSAALTASFSATQFWHIVRRTGATTVPGLGPTFIDILAKPTATTHDADNTLRHVIVQAVTPQARGFAARFGCSIMASYSMTEASGIAMTPVNAGKDGSAGRPRDGVEVRIVDPNDIELPDGTPGELIIRTQLPWVLNAGYYNNAAATAAAWRNGWFHTGDIFRRDADGDLFFVDRAKDVIRRRSENISSTEIEAEARAFPAVQDAACIGVLDDDELLLVVAPVPGHVIEPRALVEFLIPLMPHHMVPRFVRVLPDLPKTPTNRVQKTKLRDDGLTPDCWDRHQAGIILRGQRLS